jgi:hypothetical protein
MKSTVYAPCVEYESAQESLRLEHRVDGQLWAVRGGFEARAVSVRRCFPWSEPARFVSLRDRDDEEVALIREPESLDDASREVLEQALVEAGFVLRVVQVHEVEEEIEIRTWKVETAQGPRTFQTRLDDWPRDLPAGGLLIRDVAGDLYHIADREGLDEKSKKLLWAFAD